MPKISTKKSRKVARHIRDIREAKVATRPTADGSALSAWTQRNHDLICDYLVDHLDGFAEFRCWRDAYTALYEMLGAVWFQPDRTGDDLEESAMWATFDPIHFARVHWPSTFPFSLLPNGFSPRGFEHHYAGFFRFLARRQVLSADHAESLVVLLHHGLWEDTLVAVA